MRCWTLPQPWHQSSSNLQFQLRAARFRKGTRLEIISVMSHNLKRTCNGNFYIISSMYNILHSPELTNIYIYINMFAKINIQSPFALSNLQPSRPDTHWSTPPKSPPTWRKLLGTFHAKILLPWHQKRMVCVFCNTHTTLSGFGFRLILSFNQWCMMYVYVRIIYSLIWIEILHWHFHGTCQKPSWNLKNGVQRLASLPGVFLFSFYGKLWGEHCTMWSSKRALRRLQYMSI